MTAAVRARAGPGGPRDGAAPGTVGHRWAGRRTFVLALVALVAGAGVVRATTLTSARPYSSYWDEWGVVEPAARQLAEGTWDPGWYWYPSLLIDATAAVGGLLALLGVDGIREEARATVASPHLEVLGPWELILSARLLVLAASLGIVALTGALGARLAGRRAGLAAAALAACLPALVSRGSIAITDTVAALFALAAVAAASHLSTSAQPRRWAVVAGAAVGLALTSKYTPVLVAVVPAVVVVARTSLAARERVRLLLLAGVAAGVAAVVTMPVLVVHPRAVLADLRDLDDFYGRRPATDSYLEQVLRWEEVGPVVLVLAVAGFVLLARDVRTRALAVGVVAFAVLLVAVLDRSDYQHARNLAPLLPLACIGAATALVAAVRAASRRAGIRSAGVRSAAVAVATGALCVPMLLGPVRDHIEPRRGHVDSRVRAVDLLAEHVEAGDRVLVSEELAVLPSELDRLGVEVDVLPQRRPIPDGGAPYDFVVRGVLGEDPWAWAIELARRPELGRFGTILTSCAPDDPRPSCPPAPAPRAWRQNRGVVVVVGPAG